jgi:hypothetical protein
MNIGAMSTIDTYKDFEIGCKVAYRMFTRRDDLSDLVPQEVHTNDAEFKAGRFPKFVKLAPNLVLPVKPHQMVPAKHIRVCTPEPD